MKHTNWTSITLNKSTGEKMYNFLHDYDYTMCRKRSLMLYFHTKNRVTYLSDNKRRFHLPRN